MPKELTHIVFAEAVAGRLIDQGSVWLSGLLTATRAPYHAGSITADVFYYGLGRQAGLGAIVDGDHGQNTAAPMIEMLRRLKAGGDHAPDFAPQVAFAAGFLTHMALDMTFHPWVYAATGQYHASDAAERLLAVTRHRMLETWLDLHTLKQSRIGDAAARALAAIDRERRVVDPALVLWAECLARAHRIEGRLDRTVKRLHRRQLFLLSAYRSPVIGAGLRLADQVSGGRLAGVAALFDPLAGAAVPPGVLDHEGFHHPVTGLYQEGGVDHLWDQAIGRAVEFLGAADRYLVHNADIAEVTQHIHGYSLSMGLPACITAQAEHFNPLPLEALRPKRR